MIRKFRQAVDALLRGRETLLVSYCGMLEINPDERDALPESLAILNQLLTDYSALGHFKLVEPMLAENDLPARVVERARQMTDQLDASTGRCLGFIDRYRPGDGQEFNLLDLSRDLDGLGVLMADRFELEDRLIDIMNAGEEVESSATGNA